MSRSALLLGALGACVLVAALLAPRRTAPDGARSPLSPTRSGAPVRPAPEGAPAGALPPQRVDLEAAPDDGAPAEHGGPPLRGRVVDARSGAPVPRFALTVARLFAVPDRGPGAAPEPLDRPPDDAPWLAADDGRFVVTVERAGTYAVQVFAVGGGTASAVVDVGAGGAEVSLVVAPVLVVRGRVVDADGAPVADAWVELTPVVAGVGAGPEPAGGAATGPDGRFELPPVAAGTFAVGVDAAGRPSLELDRVVLDPAATDPELALTLPRGAAVEGVVVPWRAGRRAEVVFVHARGAERRVAVGDDGRFALPGLTAGRHAVHVARLDPSPAAYVADRLRAAGTGVAVDLRDGALHDLAVEDVAAAMATVRVQLVGALAPEELRVSAHREDLPLPFDVGTLFEAVPDVLGRAALEGLPPGRWRFEVRDRDGEPAGRATVDLGRGEVRELQVHVGR